ncbi:MAG: hypothetical protein ACE5JU_18015 [Candidatus Binatia bacterium]
MLAKLLKADLLPTVWIPGERERYIRELLSHRTRLLRPKMVVINELHAVYAKRNMEVAGMVWKRMRPVAWTAEDLNGPSLTAGLPCDIIMFSTWQGQGQTRPFEGSLGTD